jgi:hypothetical protein
MKQPGGLGAPHPLWEPRERNEIPQAILDWRKNVAKLPDLPELEDLLGESEGEAEGLLQGQNTYTEDMLGVEAEQLKDMADEPAPVRGDGSPPQKIPRLA